MVKLFLLAWIVQRFFELISILVIFLPEFTMFLMMRLIDSSTVPDMGLLGLLGSARSTNPIQKLILQLGAGT